MPPSPTGVGCHKGSSPRIFCHEPSEEDGDHIDQEEAEAIQDQLEMEADETYEFSKIVDTSKKHVNVEISLGIIVSVIEKPITTVFSVMQCISNMHLNV